MRLLNSKSEEGEILADNYTQLYISKSYSNSYAESKAKTTIKSTIS